MINITEFKKEDVLRVLYNNARPQGMGFLHYAPQDMTFKQAQKLLKSQLYFDYINGRVMKVNLSGNEFNPLGYDRDNGQGAAQRAINSIKKE